MRYKQHTLVSILDPEAFFSGIMLSSFELIQARPNLKVPLHQPFQNSGSCLTYCVLEVSAILIKIDCFLQRNRK